MDNLLSIGSANLLAVRRALLVCCISNRKGGQMPLLRNFSSRKFYKAGILIFEAMTKKVKSAGRFGARYGTRVRKRVAEIESIQKQRHACPACKFRSVSRNASGIWVCSKCGLKFAGGAYAPSTALQKRIVESGEEE